MESPESSVQSDPRQIVRVEEKADPHLLDFVLLLTKRKFSVLFLTLLFGAGFFAFTYVMPFTFKSSVDLLPPDKKEAEGLSSFLEKAASALNTMKSQENPSTDLFLNILQSRELSVQLARDSRIKRYFSSFDTSERGIIGLVGGCYVSEALKNNVIQLRTEIPTHWQPTQQEKDSAQVLSAYVANEAIAILDRFNQGRFTTIARLSRELVEHDYADRQHHLDSVSEALEQFERRSKAVSLKEQIASSITTSAHLQSQVEELQLKLALARTELTTNAPLVQDLEAQITAAHRAQDEYESKNGNYRLALAGLPEDVRNYADLQRELKLSEQIVSYLRMQLEQEKINERRAMPTLRVLDAAIVPDRKSSPKRATMIMLGWTVGFVVSVFYCLWREYRESTKMLRVQGRKSQLFERVDVQPVVSRA